VVEINIGSREVPWRKACGKRQQQHKIIIIIIMLGPA